ncbi:hypothetical protein BGZ63DRAFT_401719 [Mariannaea sp. PMI_226]|nr:hypothetical protein BGZ63DRAFT_401719 [Mariannaea sp. PMI_226]
MALSSNHLSLLDLPYEIHREIISHLDLHGILHLPRVNRYFSEIVNFRTDLSEEDCKSFIRGLDTSVYHRTHDLYACYKCFRFFPRDRFDKELVKDRVSRAGRRIQTDRFNRFCFSCAAKYRLHAHLRPVSNGKLRYYFCHNCGQYKTRSLKCEGPALDQKTGEFTVVATCAPKLLKQPAKIETLPKYILRNIVSHLGFQDTIKLTSVSRCLHDRIQIDQCVPLHLRYHFVRDKWEASALGVAPEAITTYPCYSCWRVRPRSKFTPKQIELAHQLPDTRWRMRCQNCLRLADLKKCLKRKNEYYLYQMCETCKHIKRPGQTCDGCMDLYERGLIALEVAFPPKKVKSVQPDYETFIQGYDGIFKDGDGDGDGDGAWWGESE